MPIKIIDLLGRKFKINPKSWEMVLKANENIPKDWDSCLTRDRYSQRTFLLFRSPNQKDYIIQIRSQPLKVYIQYKPEFLGYFEQFDMRLEYKYGKIKLPKLKSTETIWNNSNDV